MAGVLKPTYREVLRSDDPVIRRVHRLIRRTFPAHEIVEPNEWRDSLHEREAGLWSDTRWHLMVAEHRGEVVGVASGTYLGNVNIGVVGYLSVAPEARGSGVGSRMRARLRTLFRRDARSVHGRTLDAVVGEVRRDNPWLRALIRSERVLALDFTYYQPRLRPGDEPVPLVLYYEGIERPRHRLGCARIRTILYSVWQRIYRVRRPLFHAAFRRMLRELEGRTSIGEIKLRDLPPAVRAARP